MKISMSSRVEPVLETAIEQPLLRLHVVEHRRGLLRPSALRYKRVFDILFAFVFGALSLPVGLAIAFAIAIDTRGPIFFRHDRVGKGTRRFGLWKFRSMVVNADILLEQYLAQHPERHAEWTAMHKLKDDPRVTRVGRFLRRTSLDELPQLWNVLHGDMSMIGPRPIVEGEIPKYGPAFELYSQVSPGLTGLWQVSGRNDTSYRKRTRIDASYIRNWTFREDLRILLRTVSVVLRGHGAY